MRGRRSSRHLTDAGAYGMSDGATERTCDVLQVSVAERPRAAPTVWELRDSQRRGSRHLLNAARIGLNGRSPLWTIADVKAAHSVASLTFQTSVGRRAL